MNKIKLEKNITDERIDELGLKQWPIWEKESCEFPWSYADQETCYIIEGKAEVESEDGQKVEFEKGDLVIFPKGLNCTWKISTPIKKHYKFE
jgi:uncharacterized cupin superfamily protein